MHRRIVVVKYRGSSRQQQQQQLLLRLQPYLAAAMRLRKKSKLVRILREKKNCALIAMLPVFAEK